MYVNHQFSKSVYCYGAFLGKSISHSVYRKYRNLCNRQENHIGAEHLLFFPIRNELPFVKARKVKSLEFPPFAKLTLV